MIFHFPAPQWREPFPVAAFGVARLVPVLDASGFWVLPEGETPDGAFVADPSGFTVIDDTVTAGLKPTLLPSGKVVIY